MQIIWFRPMKASWTLQDPMSLGQLFLWPMSCVLLLSLIFLLPLTLPPSPRVRPNVWLWDSIFSSQLLDEVSLVFLITVLPGSGHRTFCRQDNLQAEDFVVSQLLGFQHYTALPPPTVAAYQNSDKYLACSGSLRPYIATSCFAWMCMALYAGTSFPF